MAKKMTDEDRLQKVTAHLQRAAKRLRHVPADSAIPDLIDQALAEAESLKGPKASPSAGPDPIVARLEKDLEACVWDQLRVLADRLEETGQESLASGYRFLAQTRAMPMRLGDFWHWRNITHKELPLSHALPVQVHEAMRKLSGNRIGLKWNEAESLAGAFRLAAGTIAELIDKGSWSPGTEGPFAAKASTMQQRNSAQYREFYTEDT